MSESSASTAAELVKVVPAILKLLLFAAVFCLLYTPILDISNAIAARVKSGAQAEIGPIKLEAIKTSPAALKAPTSEIVVSTDPSLDAKREQIYEQTQRFFVSHRLYPSEEPGQTYDIWIYLVPHKKQLREVESVSYYFGARAWGNRVFTSKDRGKSFGVVVSAYGPMLALVNVHLKNGKTIETWAYIDFENGSLGSRGGV